jgi:F1F0 ATPase subunit 2
VTTGTLHILLAFFVGLGIGLFYFGGLWWTVTRLPNAQRPGLWTMGSFLVRTFVSLFGFYLVMDRRWERLLVSLLGFLIARAVLVRRLRPLSKHVPDH